MKQSLLLTFPFVCLVVFFNTSNFSFVLLQTGTAYTAFDGHGVTLGFSPGTVHAKNEHKQ